MDNLPKFSQPTETYDELGSEICNYCHQLPPDEGCDGDYCKNIGEQDERYDNLHL